MKMISYLSFNGNCEAAFRLYQQCLGGELVEMHTYQASPMAADVPAEWQSKIMHVELRSGEHGLMGSDMMPGVPFQAMQGFSVALMVDSAADAERIYATLSEGAEIRMPLQETFWAERFAMLTDRFGTPWSINFEKQMG